MSYKASSVRMNFCFCDLSLIEPSTAARTPNFLDSKLYEIIKGNALVLIYRFSDERFYERKLFLVVSKWQEVFQSFQ
jgi:hypothetical protein